MEHTHASTQPQQAQSLIWLTSEVSLPQTPATSSPDSRFAQLTRWFHPLKPIRQWLDQLDVRDRKMARTIASLIPAQCPFERTVTLFGRTLFHIPPLCKLNPLYEEFVSLRFRALCYLADECGEDISAYC